MKTSLLTLAAIATLASISYAQNWKGGATAPEVRPEAPKAASCPMATTQKVTQPAATAKGSGATVTTTLVKHDPACQMPKGGHCSAN